MYICGEHIYGEYIYAVNIYIYIYVVNTYCFCFASWCTHMVLRKYLPYGTARMGRQAQKSRS